MAFPLGDWAWWEAELDFMALSGISAPLLFTGQEYVMGQVFAKLGLTESVLSSFFSGLAFQPWQRMGNEAGWGGPLSTASREAACLPAAAEDHGT
jgi:alpha-N-acetylglucosaminidase